MIKIDSTDICGWESSIRGMRNPMNSWDKSDSCWDMRSDTTDVVWFFRVGADDLKLMKSLSNAGPDHGKFLRMINVTCDITAPLYWWKEFDTYKVGTVANSCSTMHKIHAKEFTINDFSYEHLTYWDHDGELCRDWLDTLECLIDDLNVARELYVETKDKKYWWQMIQLLPSSYNQTRTIQFNYQVLKAMYFARRNHKLDEWHDFCAWCETLPYFKEICIQEDDNNE